MVFDAGFWRSWSSKLTTCCCCRQTHAPLIVVVVIVVADVGVALKWLKIFKVNALEFVVASLLTKLGCPVVVLGVTTMTATPFVILSQFTFSCTNKCVNNNYPLGSAHKLPSICFWILFLCFPSWSFFAAFDFDKYYAYAALTGETHATCNMALSLAHIAWLI